MANSTNLYQKLHEQSAQFGARKNAGGLTHNMAIAVTALAKKNIYTILDYGTGKGNFVHGLRSSLGDKYIVDGYDPSVKEWSNKPNRKYDITTCIDVLEHLEHFSVDEVLNDICTKTNKFCFLLIDLQPAVQYLENGRNAHTLLAPHDWWASKVSNYFPYTINFPIYHQKGFTQKYIITGSRQPKSMNEMMLFVNKLDICSVMMRNPRAKK